MDDFIPAMNTRRTPRPQGFSLIELMIAMTIGLILTMIIGQVFINSKQVFSSTDQLGRLQENARYAITNVTRQLRQSTYRSDPRVTATRTVVFVAGGAPVPSLTGTDGGTTGTPASGVSDILTVRYQGAGGGTGTAADGTIQDCAGTRIDAQAFGTFVTATYFVKNDPNNNNEPTLYCTLEVPPSPCTIATCAPCTSATTCFPLVPGVENMQVTYGEDKLGSGTTSLTPDGSIDRFVDASQVANFENVLSVRISLLLRTDDRVANAPNSTSYSMTGTTVYGPATSTDLRLRRVFTTTVDLRNRTL
jgi:type IV pilus assembly protein PilW